MTLQPLPSGKRLHNYGKSPCLMGKPWKIHYFDWAIFYVAFCMFTISGNGKTPSLKPLSSMSATRYFPVP